MNNDFTELIQYLDNKFSKIDTQLEYLKENKVDKSDFDRLLTAVDSYAHKADAYFQEMVALTHKY